MQKSRQIFSIREAVHFLLDFQGDYYGDSKERLVWLIPDHIIVQREDVPGYDPWKIIDSLEVLSLEKWHELAVIVGLGDWQKDKKQEKILFGLVNLDPTMQRALRPQIFEKIKEIRFLDAITYAVLHS
ncbi:MAG TPA: hypothetical protein P5056_01650 [Candidatus Paceibacterota bacterium]|nr:hypothetical protein [Candidatus Paceibacterota bacterium]